MCNSFKFLHSALDSGLIPAAIFLDVRKAFDSLTHGILLFKLSHYGVRGILMPGLILTCQVELFP